MVVGIVNEAAVSIIWWIIIIIIILVILGFLFRGRWG